jgi:CBS domain containing-hemolysin-like protein
VAADERVVLIGALATLALAIALVLLAGAFAAADAALGTVSRAGVEDLARSGGYGARQLVLVVADRPRHVNLLLLLRLVCELTATVLVTMVALAALSPTWLAVLVTGVVMVLVSYVVIGFGPRTIGRQHPYGVGRIVAGPVRALGWLLGPLSRLLILVGNAITPGRGFREGPFSSEVELRELVEMAGERGVVAAGEAEMIQSVFDLGDTVAREVMVPRTEIVWIEQDKAVRQALALCLRSGFSRIPVIAESVDDIVGIANIKDLARHAESDLPDHGQRPVAEVMRPPAFVPDSKRLTALLTEMQMSRNHMAVVVDEYGGTAGLVTIEDILEEIVGEITDESDTGERPPVEQLADGSVRIIARLGVADLGELFDVELDDSDVETVGGLLAQQLGRVPLPGAEAEVAGLRLRAEGGKDNRGRMRITTVTAWQPEPRDSDRAADTAGATQADDTAAPRPEGSDARAR